MNIELFTTAPESTSLERDGYLCELKRIALESEKHGYKGILIYSNNRLADPWMTAGFILSETEKLLPMIALQPVYNHPYTVAKMISTLALMYNRPIALNLIAGGFVNDLKALGDQTEHNKRYDRLIEYTDIIQQLLKSKLGVTYEGEYYRIENLKLEPPLPESLQPSYYISGSSQKAKETAARLCAQLIEYPEPFDAYSNSHENKDYLVKGIRIGILARHTHEKAWSDARERFPETRIGELSHELAKKTSDSEWHEKLSNQHQNGNGDANEPVYWLGPFKHYQTFCPYLVGDFEEVASELSSYIKTGCVTCILDIPVSELELQNTLRVFNQAHLQAVEL